MKLVAFGVDGSWDFVGVSSGGGEMFVKPTASITAATAAATPKRKRLQQDTRHLMRLMALMIAGDGRPKALWWCCERRRRKDVCQTYRVFDDSNVSRRPERTQQDSRHPTELIELMSVAVAAGVGRPTRLVVVV
jgi:hypothetical protein